MRLKIKLIVAIIGFSALVVLIPTAKAADNGGSGLIISPPIKEIQISPNGSDSNSIKVTNPNSSTVLNVVVTVEDFQAQGETGQQTFMNPSDANTFSLGNWITIEKNFTLKGDQTKDIAYKINAPANAEPGGHYGVILFSPTLANPQSLSSSGVMAVPEIGSLLLVTVPGDIKYGGSIAQFSAPKKLYLDSTNIISFLTRFQNMGTSHIKPSGNIVITNLLGQTVATIPVNADLGNVLPNSIRKFENLWTKKYGFGKYKANVSLVFGNNQTTTATLAFWIIPWKEVTGVIVILLILIFIGRHLRWSAKPDKDDETDKKDEKDETDNSDKEGSDVSDEMDKKTVDDPNDKTVDEANEKDAVKTEKNDSDKKAENE